MAAINCSGSGWWEEVNKGGSEINLYLVSRDCVVKIERERVSMSSK